MPTKATHDFDDFEIIEGDEPPHLFAIKTAGPEDDWFVAFSHVAIGEHGISLYADVGVDAPPVLAGGLTDGVEAVPDDVLRELATFPEYHSRVDGDRDE